MELVIANRDDDDSPSDRRVIDMIVIKVTRLLANATVRASCSVTPVVLRIARSKSAYTPIHNRHKQPGR